jgi:hypothetical protein
MSTAQRVSLGFHRLGLLVAAILLLTGEVHAATPCDFKGLSVGDKATPQEIMQHFGIAKYITENADSRKMTDAAYEAYWGAINKRANTVGMENAMEEERWNRGPVCNESYCDIPYGISVGNEPKIPVGVFVGFDSTGTVTAIDVSYDYLEWDEVLEMLNAKYGDNWDKRETPSAAADYETKKSEPFEETVLTHRNVGTNPKTGDTCSIVAQSQDHVFYHTVGPRERSVLEIKLISKNF